MAVSAPLIDLNWLQYVQYGDGQSYSMPFNIIDQCSGMAAGCQYSVGSTPGAIKDLVVVATGTSGGPVYTNFSGMDNAHGTPNSSGVTFFRPEDGSSNGTEGTVNNNGTSIWDTYWAGAATGDSASGHRSRKGFPREPFPIWGALRVYAAGMRTFYNNRHVLHQGRQEMFRGRMVDCFEVPARVDHVLTRWLARGLGPVEQAPPSLSDALLQRIHTPAYLQFLSTAWDDWVAMDPSNAERDALPSVWPNHGLRNDVLPRNFAARMGRYAFDTGSPLTSGTWVAARQGAACAVAAAQDIAAGARSSFSLSRPPGHHAGADFYGGYCFLNNAALAAQHLRDQGCARVAVLDVDYHHGNGTQAIFYDRADVFFASVHGDPLTEYPFFLGHADETGSGAGVGCNLNLPLPRGTGFDAWRAALAHALQATAGFGADALVLSLGLDTYEGDPISGFTLRSEDFLRVGEDIAAAGLPTVFVFEGGYAVDALGVNAVNVLEGFQHRAAG